MFVIISMGSMEELYGSHQCYLGWVMVLGTNIEKRVIVFSLPNLFGVKYIMSSHRVGY